MTPTYDPQLVSFTFRGLNITGFATGSAITAERNEDTFALSVGIGGEAGRAKNANRSGTVTIQLQHTALANDLLSAIAVEDERLGTGVGALMVKDHRGNTLLAAINAWIRKMPAVEFSNEISAREWVFETDALEMWVGGSLG
jgi:hypothetical protein